MIWGGCRLGSGEVGSAWDVRCVEFDRVERIRLSGDVWWVGWGRLWVG